MCIHNLLLYTMSIFVKILSSNRTVCYDINVDTTLNDIATNIKQYILNPIFIYQGIVISDIENWAVGYMTKIPQGVLVLYNKYSEYGGEGIIVTPASWNDVLEKVEEWWSFK